MHILILLPYLYYSPLCWQQFMFLIYPPLLTFSRQILGRSPQTIQRLIQSILDEFHLDTDSCCLRLAGSKASVDPLADVALLEGDVLVIEETNRSNVSGEGKGVSERSYLKI